MSADLLFLAGQVISGYFSIVLLAFCFYFNIYECVCTSPEGTGQLVGVGFLLPCGVQELNADLQAWW